MELAGIVGLRLKVYECCLGEVVQSQPIWPGRKGGAEDREQGHKPKPLKGWNAGEKPEVRP